MSIQIAVNGRAEVKIAPELGAVSVTVSASGPDRQRPLRDVSESHERLLASVRALDAEGVLDRWSATQLRTWAHRPWNSDGKQLALVYNASAAVEIVFSDLGRLSEWVGSAGEEARLSVGGVSWQLTDATNRRVREEAQREAVADAVAKAVVYADAVGAGRPVAVEIADTGMLSAHPVEPPQPVYAMARASFAKADAAPPAPELAPADLVIAATVDARFSAEPRA
ncbi:SIMPL domain-containing protein [Agromyces protaetiae]|uniref:SIMPL domain-containing protein n=1 Tax=Agromyces protaetiae TaxID=2509455 RepID=UPI0013EB630C|nr:SIMPL domain-containing protein [Agromyces protaetiae]